MRFITVRDLRTHPAQVWKALGDAGELIVTSNGRPIAVLTPTSPETLDSSLAAVRRARAVQAVSELQRASAHEGRDRLRPADVEAEIAAVRRHRRR